MTIAEWCRDNLVGGFVLADPALADGVLRVRPRRAGGTVYFDATIGTHHTRLLWAQRVGPRKERATGARWRVDWQPFRPATRHPV